MNDFIDKKNKELLWNTLYNSDKFKEFDNSHFDTIVQLFETTITSTAKSNHFTTLLDINKLFISQFLTQLNQYKLNQSIYKREDILKQKETALNNQHQESIKLLHEFDEPTPKSIDFSDAKDDPIDLDSKLAKIIESRNATEPISLDKIYHLLCEIKENQLKLLKINKI